MLVQTLHINISLFTTYRGLNSFLGVSRALILLHTFVLVVYNFINALTKVCNKISALKTARKEFRPLLSCKQAYIDV